jgi:hypothetical protein
MISKKDGRYKGAADMVGIPLVVIYKVVGVSQNMKQHLQSSATSLT